MKATIKKAYCKNCNKELIPSEIAGYTYQCLDCDEDFYKFEALKAPRKLNALDEQKILMEILSLTEIEKKNRPELITKGFFPIGTNGAHGYCVYDNTGAKLQTDYTGSYKEAVQLTKGA